jgi:glutamate 5-kinase
MPNKTRNKLHQSKRIVIKVGTSSLTYENGKINTMKMHKLVRAITELVSQGKEIVLVTSGAVGIGMEKLKSHTKQKTIGEKQAAASIGQCELMYMYSRFFSDYGHIIGQILLTRDVIEEQIKCSNVINTFENLLKNGIIPIVNENDTVSTEELERVATFGDNDTLSAIVSKIIKADLLIILSDIEGLCTGNPKTDNNCTRISSVTKITKDIEDLAQGAGSKRGTGGMITKISAAKIATSAGVAMIIASGDDPEIVIDILKGLDIGTLFKSNSEQI